MKKTIGIMALCGLAGAASGQVTPIGPFTGDLQEGFVNVGLWPPNGPCTFCPSIDMFPGGIATVTSPAGTANMHCTGGWSFACQIGARATPRIFASNGGGGVDWTFDPGSEPGMFGGYFGSNSGTADGRAEFYDPSGVLVSTQPLTIPADCSWNWHGWEITTLISKIRIISNRSGGGYIQHDDMEWSAFGGAPCYPDCDTSTGVGVLDIFDFLCFQNRYDAGSPYACDCDTSTGPGVCDIFDFLCFQNAYDQGCP